MSIKLVVFKNLYVEYKYLLIMEPDRVISSSFILFDAHALYTIIQIIKNFLLK